jgi:hypothetical protein
MIPLKRRPACDDFRKKLFEFRPFRPERLVARHALKNNCTVIASLDPEQTKIRFSLPYKDLSSPAQLGPGIGSTL